MLEAKSFSFVGCGNMGEAILRRLLESNTVTPDQVSVAVRSHERQQYLRKTYHVNVTSPKTAVKTADFVFVAVKPQQLADLPVFELRQGVVVVSILAGTTIERLKEHFPTAQIARTMPNLGYGVGSSATGLLFDTAIEWRQVQQDAVRQLLATGGAVIEVVSEDELNAVTAVAGSGPAYFYWFAEQVAESAKCLGFSDEEAQKIAREVFIGSAEVIKATPEISLGEWRERVTSKGGTTAAALNVFNASDTQRVVASALEAARDRARELSV